MRFLFIYPSPGILGGVETLIARMSRWLVQNGHEVTLLVQWKKNWSQLLPKEVQCVALEERFSELYYYYHAKRLWRQLGLPKPDVIKGFHFGSTWIACQLGDIIGDNCKVIAGMYEPSVFRWYCAPGSQKPWSPWRLFLRNYLNNIPANARIFCGQDQVDELKEMHAQSGILWPIPVDTKQFEPAIRKPKWGKIVSVGRLSPMKEYNLYMIDVVKELRKRGHEVTWTVYGVGEYEAEMRTRIKESGLENAIVMGGTAAYERFWQVIEDAHVFVGMGTALMEASLFRVPNVNAVAYDREGVTDGPIYRLPKGSVGPGLDARPKLKVADEIERILRLNSAGYQQEEDLVYRHVQAHEMETSMNEFISLVRCADRITPAKSLYLLNYPFWFVRRIVGKKAKDDSHPGQFWESRKAQ